MSADRERRLADLEQLRALQARYCRLVDGGDAAAFAGLFVEDGIWAAGPVPLLGRAAIREHAGAPARLRFHLAANPLLDLDGDLAHARWHGLVATTRRDGGAVWVAGRYENDCIRSADGWRFSRVRFRVAFAAEYAAGWAAQSPTSGVRAQPSS